MNQDQAEHQYYHTTTYAIITDITAGLPTEEAAIAHVLSQATDLSPAIVELTNGRPRCIVYLKRVWRTNDAADALAAENARLQERVAELEPRAQAADDLALENASLKQRVANLEANERAEWQRLSDQWRDTLTLRNNELAAAIREKAELEDENTRLREETIPALQAGYDIAWRKLEACRQYATELEEGIAAHSDKIVELVQANNELALLNADLQMAAPTEEQGEERQLDSGPALSWPRCPQCGQDMETQPHLLICYTCNTQISAPGYGVGPVEWGDAPAEGQGE